MRARRTSTGASIAAILAIGLAACAGSAPSAAPGASAELPSPVASAPSTAMPGGSAPAAVDALRYTCGAFPFPAALLEVARNDELAQTPAAAALRTHLLTEGLDFEWLPDAGWTLVGQDATGAEFLADAGDMGLATVTVEPDGGEWRVTGWGQCHPSRVLPEGLNEAEWVLADPDAIDPTTTTFEALVTERECASGQSSEGRIVGPDVLAAGEDLLVTFAGRPLEGDAFACPGNPPTRVTVTLPEPLGDRRLLDGSTLPPREPIPEP